MLVWLDGVLQKDVIAFSTPGGWIKRVKRFNGERLIDYERGDFATETVRGRVQAEWRL